MAHLDARHCKISGIDISIAMLSIAVLFVFVTTQSQAQTLTVLHNFTEGNDGGGPIAGVTLDQQGRIYGTTDEGGSSRLGVVYRLVRSGDGWTLTTLHTFQGAPNDGNESIARVVFGPDGTLYGTTYLGGTFDAGIVFNLRPPATACKAVFCLWTETVLHSFSGDGPDGGYPSYGDLNFDASGNIYGTASGGGAFGQGVVFKLTRSGSEWTESVLWNFTRGDDGENPQSGVIFDSAGNLYGTATLTVYELSPSPAGWTETTLYTFTDQDNGEATGGLVMDANGNLFGLTGDQGPGEAYELSFAGGQWNFTRLQTFTGQYPGPRGAPTLDAQGNLYGSLPTYGQDGEIFKLMPSGGGWTYTHFFDFDNNNGANPLGAVTFDGNGNMYGTTYAGGSRFSGVVWEITR